MPITFIKLAMGFVLGIAAPKIIVTLPNIVPDMAILFRRVVAVWLKVPDVQSPPTPPAEQQPKNEDTQNKP